MLVEFIGIHGNPVWINPERIIGAEYVKSDFNEKVSIHISVDSKDSSYESMEYWVSAIESNAAMLRSLT